MSTGIELRTNLSRAVLPESSEPQLLYVLLEAVPQGAVTTLPKLPLNLCLVIDRSSSMRGDRLYQVKEAAHRIIDQMGDDDYFALVTFNDRAEVVIAAQKVRNKADLKHLVSTVEAAGGTEMANGLALAVQEIQRPMLRQSISRMLLLTDGRTYGDEGRCVEITRRAQSRGVGLNAIGIGHEWNEDLLETMAARENSRTQYITTASEIAAVFADELKRMHSVFAQGVKFRIEVRPGGMLRSFDRVRPFLTNVPIMEEKELCWVAATGDWPSSDTQAFLLELMVPPLAAGEHPLMRLALNYTQPGASGADQRADSVLRISVRPSAAVTKEVDATVKHWLERLVAYRLQSSAWQDVEAGRIEDATRRLQMAGTRLFEAGETELARTVQDEATRLLRSGQATSEGRKRIKYGTRGLMGGGDHSQEAGA